VPLLFAASTQVFPQWEDRLVSRRAYDPDDWAGVFSNADPEGHWEAVAQFDREEAVRCTINYLIANLHLDFLPF